MMETTHKPARPWGVALFYLAFMAATVGGFWAIHWKMEVASEHGKGVDNMILFLLIATGVMFVAGHAVTAWFLVGSRREGSFRAPSPRAEWTATLVPILIVVIAAEAGVLTIGMPVWAQIAANDPDAVRIRIVGKQFEWVAHYCGPDGKWSEYDPKEVDGALNPIGIKDADYSDDIVAPGVIIVPLGRTVQIQIRSMDVLHSFTVPMWRTKQDAVPGMPTRTQVKPTREGTYEVVCAEICGLGHYKMRAFVAVVPEAEFKTAMESQDDYDALVEKLKKSGRFKVARPE